MRHAPKLGGSNDLLQNLFMEIERHPLKPMFLTYLELWGKETRLEFCLQNYAKMLIRRQKACHFGSLLWVFLLHAVVTSLVSGYDEGIPMDQVTHKDVITKVNQALHFLDTMKTHENNILGPSMVQPGTPFHGVSISYAPEEESLTRGRAGVVATRSTQMMVGWHCRGLLGNKRAECARKASMYTMMGTALHDSCANLTQYCTPEEYSSVYRFITGYCNHKEAHQGESFTAYVRLLNAVYLDSVETPRRAVDKKPLPNARFVSGSVTKFNEVLHDSFTMAVLQWGQFLEQDLSRPAISPMYHYANSFKCCKDDGFNLSPRYVHKFCSPISLSVDSFYSTLYKHCMSYVRSFPALRSDCSFGPQEQLNQATHFLDGSQIYGSSNNRNRFLRGTEGYYRTSKINNKDYLPLSPNPTEDCMVSANKSLCFISGDPRVNFEPQITVMHTLWAREHNRLVDELRRLSNRHWNDDDLYEEARRIVIAMMQHITYSEWVENVLAEKYQNEINVYPSFSENINPSVFNSLGIGVMRSLKSLYSSKIGLYSEDRKEIDRLSLQNVFYKPEIVSNPDVFDSLARAIATQSSGKIDTVYAEDLINKLYASDDFGYDILTLDIQRGRDHGLPPYNSYRKYLGFKYATSFSDLRDVMSTKDYNKLSRIYTSPSDIDFIIGGLMEQPLSGSLFGPTFSWILTNQLIRSKQGDRYFYTNPNQPKPFTKPQMEQIKKITLARIMCDNSDILKIQPNVFQKISDSNNLVRCDGTDIPRMDLHPWMDKTNAYSVV